MKFLFLFFRAHLVEFFFRTSLSLQIDLYILGSIPTFNTLLIVVANVVIEFKERIPLVIFLLVTFLPKLFAVRSHVLS